jgi:hypothetical protein
MRNLIAYLYKTSSVAFQHGMGIITEREKDCRITELNITSKATNRYDATKALKRFMNKYDKNALSSDARRLVELLLKHRPEVTSMLDEYMNATPHREPLA